MTAKILSLPLLGASALAAVFLLQGGAFAEEKETTPEQQLIAHYEQVSTALVEDKLEQTHATAKQLKEAAQEAAEKAGRDVKKDALTQATRLLEESENLKEARERFIQVSKLVIALADDKKGYFVMHCPMVKDGLWLQSDRAVKNPYMGQRMIRCGGMKRETGEEEEASTAPAGSSNGTAASLSPSHPAYSLLAGATKEPEEGSACGSACCAQP